MTSIPKEKPIYLTMLDDSIANCREQLAYAYKLNQCMFDLRDNPNELLVFCEAVMTKVSDIQLFLGESVTKTAGLMTPESIAQFTLFAQQLLSMYQVASQMYLSISSPNLSGHK